LSHQGTAEPRSERIMACDRDQSGSTAKSLS
jgi:hypothetical protein